MSLTASETYRPGRFARVMAAESAAGRRVKAAGVELPPSPLEQNALLRQAALKDILAAGMFAAAGGVGARALLGSNYLFGPPPHATRRKITPTAVPVPRPAEKEAAPAPAVAPAAAPRRPAVDPFRLFRGLKKTGPKTQQFASPPVKLAQDGAGGGAATAAAPAGGWFSQLLAGGKATAKGGIPWYWPGLAAAGIGGAVGGYAATDALLDKKRKADLAAEVEAAKEEYRRALSANYAAPKTAAAPSPGERLGRALDALADRCGVTDDTPHEKAAAAGEALGAALVKRALTANDAAGGALGAYATFALPVTLLSALAAYRYGRARSSDKLLEDALKQRERDRAGRRPPEVFAVPSAVRSHSVPVGG